MRKQPSSPRPSAIEQAEKIVLPEFTHVDTPVVATIVALRILAEKQAFPGISLEISPAGREQARHLRITLSLADATVAEACRRIAELARLELVASAKAILFDGVAPTPEVSAMAAKPNASDVIRPENIPAFERLIMRVNAAKKGSLFSAAHWKKLNATLRHPCPKWYQDFTKAYALAGAGFHIALENQDRNDDRATFAILPPKELLTRCTDDYFFADDNFPQWFQFAEAVGFGPTRWLIPADDNAEPIVHTFSDGDSDPCSLDCRFDDLLLRATFDPSL